MSEFIEQQHLVLASGSVNRAKLLKDAGLTFDIIPSGVDEEAIKVKHDGNNFSALALELAEAKARQVSTLKPESIIIAADQLCVYQQQIFDKPLSIERAIEQLNTLQNSEHELISAVCLFKAGKAIWSYAEKTSLKMRQLTNKQIQHYIELERPLQSCGSYHFEGRGQWLFEDVSSDVSTIVGIPMLALMNQLIALKLVKIF